MTRIEFYTHLRMIDGVGLSEAESSLCECVSHGSRRMVKRRYGESEPKARRQLESEETRGEWWRRRREWTEMESSRRRSNGCNQSDGHLGNARRRSRRVLSIRWLEKVITTTLFYLTHPFATIRLGPPGTGPYLTRYVSCDYHINWKLFRFKNFFSTHSI